MIKDVIPYLAFLEEIGVDSITVGDPGVIHLLRTKGISLPYLYDGQTLVTSSNQINFLGKTRCDWGYTCERIDGCRVEGNHCTRYGSSRGARIRCDLYSSIKT
nr:U32 family peptidase [Oceanobacillus saliphilus]